MIKELWQLDSFIATIEVIAMATIVKAAAATAELITVFVIMLGSVVAIALVA
jgi:hypothetical protein